MVALVAIVVGIAVLLLPEVFVALGRETVEHPGVGGMVVVLLGLIGGWIYKRLVCAIGSTRWVRPGCSGSSRQLLGYTHDHEEES